MNHPLQRLRPLATLLVVAGLAGCGEDGPAPVGPAPIRPPDEASSSAVRPPGGSLKNAIVAKPPTSDDPTDPQNWKVTGPDDDPTIVEIGGLHARKLPTWTWQQPTMQFRTLQFAVPGRDGAGAADLIFSLFFEQEGGPTELNVDRWSRQFLDDAGQPTQPVMRERIEYEQPTLLVEHRGAYLQMGAAAPRGDHAQIAAVIEAPKRRVFVRLVGPSATVDANRDAFMEMVGGFRAINLALPEVAPNPPAAPSAAPAPDASTPSDPAPTGDATSSEPPRSAG